MTRSPFAELATRPSAPVEELALAIAAEFRAVDADAVRRRLDLWAGEVGALRRTGRGVPAEDVAALVAVLADRHGLRGDPPTYSEPESSMIDRVLERRRGLPILLSAVYVAVAERAGIPLAGIGLPGHFVVGHLGADPPVLVDPFAGGAPLPVPRSVVPWPAHAIAMRMLNNLVSSYAERGALTFALRAAELRFALPAHEPERTRLRTELVALRARLN